MRVGRDPSKRIRGGLGGGFLDVPALFLGQDDDDDVEDGKRGKGSG